MDSHFFKQVPVAFVATSFWIDSCPHANGTGDPVLCISWKYHSTSFWDLRVFAQICGFLRKICGFFAGNSHRLFLGFHHSVPLGVKKADHLWSSELCRIFCPGKTKAKWVIITYLRATSPQTASTTAKHCLGTWKLLAIQGQLEDPW